MKKRKLISLILCIIMIVSISTTAVFAAGIPLTIGANEGFNFSYQNSSSLCVQPYTSLQRVSGSGTTYAYANTLLYPGSISGVRGPTVTLSLSALKTVIAGWTDKGTCSYNGSAYIYDSNSNSCYHFWY